MKSVWIYAWIMTDISVFSVFATAEIETDVPDEMKCSSNLSPYSITTSYGPKIICAYLSPERLNWDDAKFRCNLIFAQLSQQMYFKSSLRIELLKKGIDVLWIGIRRRNNFFVTEYPSKLFREADSFAPDYWGNHWSDDEPGLNDCVAINISSGSLQTRNCGDILPFVCDGDWKDISTIHKNLACPEGWNISFPLSASGRTCIFTHKGLMHENAEEICAINDGRLATFNEYKILSNSNSGFSINDKDFWIKNKKIKLCEVTKNINGHISTTIPTSCMLKHPFVCVKHYKRPNINLSLSPKSLQPMQSDSKDAADLFTCDFETDVPKLNVESGLLFQWYKNSLPIPVNSYVMRLSFIGDGLKRDPYIYDIASRQGYYHCEVQLPGSNETYVSPKMKFFYSDIATFVVEIRGIKQTNNMDYSHQHFTDNMDEFDEASMSFILEKVKTRYPEVEWDFMSKSTLNGEAIMKIVVYVYKTGVEDFDERMACEEVKDALQELHSVPIFMEKMSAYINCEEFPIRNGYVQVIKSLNNIEARLSRMESTQEYILEKLKVCEKSRNGESEQNNYELDVEQFLEAVDDLKRLEQELLQKARKHGNSNNGHDEQERNEVEDRFYYRARNRISEKSRKMNRPTGTHEPSDFEEELEFFYNEHPENDWQVIPSKRVVNRKDL